MIIESGGKHVLLTEIPFLIKSIRRIYLFKIVNNQIDKPSEIPGVTIKNLRAVYVFVIEITECTHSFENLIGKTETDGKTEGLFP